MMPFWLQLVCAVSAGLVSALMGIALVPFLQKLRLFPPDVPKAENAEAAHEEHRPAMGGLLLLAGILFSLVLSGTLWLTFSGADRTALTDSDQFRKFIGAGVYTAILCGVGILSDILLARGRYNAVLWSYITLPIVLLDVIMVIASLAFAESELIANHWLVLLPIPACVCFVWEFDLEHDTDGALISVNAVELLVLTMLFLRRSFSLPALLTLAGAGACLGCMVWCLHPAKCRLGRSGCYLLGGLVPSLCLLSGMYKELALFMAVFFLQQLYRRRKSENKYLTEAMAESGIAPHGRIAILAGLAAFCGGLALLLK